MSHQRYLGLELSGAKNAKTTIAVLEYYPKEKKVFLLDIHSGIGADQTVNSDEALIDTILDHSKGSTQMKMGVSVPLTLPPCLLCNRKICNAKNMCNTPEVKWMHSFWQRHAQTKVKRPISKKTARQKDFFTPYTQRPVELWLKYEVMKHIPKKIHFELDEALGGNKAPLTARMYFLQRHLHAFQMHEVLPKLTVALLMPSLRLTFRTLRMYRSLEDGAFARQTILERMCEHLDIFIYERDMKKLTTNLNAFDAFLCAYTVMLLDRGECVSPPRGFPADSGWVDYPKSQLLDPRYDIGPLEIDEEEEE
ncbi:MAG: hypothetical protein JST80_09505 [Bdellovibrionales bacterium]|nr:hypothetical protein [Bdellovibrionales bacterium]